MKCTKNSVLEIVGMITQEANLFITEAYHFISRAFSSADLHHVCYKLYA
jgi:hypothetical protein